MTPERLAEIRARAEAATEGPWVATDYEAVGMPGSVPWAVDCNWPDTLTVAMIGRGYGETDEPRFNAQFIAHARQDIPDLLAELARVTAERDQLQAIFERDILQDSEAVRVVYDRGKKDGMSATLNVLKDAADYADALKRMDSVLVT